MVSPFLVFCEMSVVLKLFFFIFSFCVHGFMFSFFSLSARVDLTVLFYRAIFKKGFYSGDRRMRSFRPVMAA